MPDLLQYESGRDRLNRREPISGLLSAAVFGLALVMIVSVAVAGGQANFERGVRIAGMLLMVFVGLPLGFAAVLPPAEPRVVISSAAILANLIGAIFVYCNLPVG